MRTRLGARLWLVLVGVGILGTGLYDYTRGQDALPRTVEICSTECAALDPGAVRVVLDATLGDRAALSAVQPEGNLCRYAAEALQGVGRDADITTFATALAVEGIATLRQEADSWQVSAGAQTGGIGAALGKLVQPASAHQSCLAPATIWYGPLGGVLVVIGLFLLLMAPRPPKVRP